ncbi:MAG: ribonuclease E inhibitor RraB, partial [Fimbriimonadaceae bacterium]
MAQLREAQCDLSKPHQIDFAAVFPSGEAAREFKLSLPKELVARLIPQGGFWLCEVQALILPTLENLDVMRIMLSKLAKKHGGYYDGSKRAEGPDDEVLAQLKLAGSDLSKPHMVEFFLYLPTRESALAVGADLGSGYQCDISESAG